MNCPVNLTLVGLLPVQDLGYEYCYGALAIGKLHSCTVHTDSLVPRPSLATGNQNWRHGNEATGRMLVVAP